MIYAYIRVSSDRQTTENQRFEIQRFAAGKGLCIVSWIDETISSRKALKDRAFGKLLHKLKRDDTLIISEISRMGRSLMQIMSILNICMDKGVKVFAIKEGWELGDNINSKVLAFAFGLSAEIERKLISQRVTEALARKKAEGIILGRPKGSKKSNPILAKHEAYIRRRVSEGAKQSDIARALKCHRHTVKDFITEHNLVKA